MRAPGPLLLAAGALAALSWYLLARKENNGAGGALWPLAGVGEAVEDAAQTLDGFTGGMMKLSEMAKVTAAQVAHRNVQAFLRVIRRGEGTADFAGYSRLFGGALFQGFADHPRKMVTTARYKSTAAGAYQALVSTWDETRRIMNLPDFSPASQDRFAVGRIAARGALQDVIAGRFDAAVRKCAREWASLPYSPYGQPVITMQTASSVYLANGGTMQAGAA